MERSLTNTKLQFPWKLHKLLENVEAEGSVAIVSWLPHGKAFRVHSKPKFISTVMASYFNSTKYKSFQRNLNLWGFETITQGPDKGAIYHRFFIKNIPDLCARMIRQKIKGASSSDPSSDSSKTSSSAPGALTDAVNASVFNASHNGVPQAEAERAESIRNALRHNPGLFPNRSGAGDDASLFGKGLPEAGVSVYNNGASSRAEEAFAAAPQGIRYDRPGGPEAADIARLLAPAGLRPFAPTPEPSPEISTLMALLQNRSNPYSNTQNRLLDMANNSNRLSAEKLLGLDLYSRGFMTQSVSSPLAAPANNQHGDTAALVSVLAGAQVTINSLLASLSAKV
jgi:hypothetical protein